MTTLWCNDYHAYPKDFPKFVLLPAQKLIASMHTFDDPQIVFWNTDKHYLLELGQAGYHVPRSKLVNVGKHSHSSLESVIEEPAKATPLVLKPTVSGSARSTHLIEVPKALTPDDLAFLDRVLTEGTSGDLILQEYEEDISGGEYSLIFVDGTHTHTILKMPQAGEYRCQGEYGGSTEEIVASDVPQGAREAAQQLWDYLEVRAKKSDNEAKGFDGSGLVYARIDGIMKDGTLILMEVEAIEPHSWLEAETGNKALVKLCRVFFHK